jgi:hypothetical protein
VQQLIGAEAKNLDDLRIEPGDGALGELGAQEVERGAPALDAARDLAARARSRSSRRPLRAKAIAVGGRRCRRIPR